MKKAILIIFCFLFAINSLLAQTRADLEQKRSKTLEEIAYVDNLLKTTAKAKTEGINTIRIIGNKLTLRESVINGMKDEISLLSDRIDLNEIAISMMEDDLVILRNDYAKAVLNSYRLKKGTPELVYILSARDFNQGYKRLKYLQQITKFRRRESEIIYELKSQIESTKLKLQSDLYKVSDLKSREEQQKAMLQSEQQKQQKIVKSLSSKEKQLKKDLDEKKRIAKEIDKGIARLIEEERKRAVKTDITPEEKLIGENFIENKGKLPWPVEKGIITSHFGIQKNAVLKYLTENNVGIEITSSGKIQARSVFKGEVAGLFAIAGANMTVMVRHGKFFSVYTNLINVKVNKGDRVETKQSLGEVFSNPTDNNNSVLKFMIYETKYQDPELWLAK